MKSEFYADLIGKPFAWGGRGPDVFDCYGIVRFVLQRTGVHIPDYLSTDSGNVNGLTIMSEIWKFTTSEREAGAIVTFKMDRAIVTHIGLMLDFDRFIHITEQTSVVIEKLSSPLWKRRAAGFYQWPY